MKKFLLIGILAVVVLAAVAFAGVAYVNAQAPTPNTPQNWGMGRMMGGGISMQEYMHEAVAAKLGLSEDELESAYADGKTAWLLAQEQGLTQEQFAQLMVDARAEALEKMVADGVITSEQADWMNSRGGQRMGGGFGNCPMFDGQGGTPNSSNRNGRRGGGMMGGGNW